MLKKPAKPVGSLFGLRRSCSNSATSTGSCWFILEKASFGAEDCPKIIADHADNQWWCRKSQLRLANRYQTIKTLNASTPSTNPCGRTTSSRTSIGKKKAFWIEMKPVQQAVKGVR